MHHLLPSRILNHTRRKRKMSPSTNRDFFLDFDRARHRTIMTMILALLLVRMLQLHVH